MRRLIVAVAALTLLMTPPAFGWTVNDVIQDCVQNGKLTHDYPPSLIRKARNSLPADVDEYTDCRDLLSTPTGGGGGSGSGDSGAGVGGGGLGGGGGHAGGGSSTAGSAQPSATPAPPSPTELKALEDAKTTGETVDVGGTPLMPGAAGMTTGAVDNRLPSTLLVALILLALAVAAAGGPVLRRRCASGRSLHPSRVFVRRRR